MENIGAAMPKQIINRMIKTVGGEEKHIVDDIIENNKRAPEKLKRVLRDLRDNKKAFDTTRQEEDPKVIAEANRFVEKRIAHELRTGRLKPAEEDKFIRKIKKLTKGKPVDREIKWKPNPDRNQAPPARRRWTHS